MMLYLDEFESQVYIFAWFCEERVCQFVILSRVWISAPKISIRRFVITEKAPTGAFSWLKAATTAFTFKTLLRHYAKQALTPRSLNVKLGPRRKGHIRDRTGRLVSIVDRVLREYYNQDFLHGVCPSRLFRTFNEANILLIVYFDNMFDLQSQKLQLESV